MSSAEQPIATGQLQHFHTPQLAHLPEYRLQWNGNQIRKVYIDPDRRPPAAEPPNTQTTELSTAKPEKLSYPGSWIRPHGPPTDECLAGFQTVKGSVKGTC